LFDAGYVDAEFLVTAQSQHEIEVVGPLSANSGWQRRAATGYGFEACALDWEAETARCPQGSHRVRWTPGHDVSGDPVGRIRFHGPTCRACEGRSRCTAAKDQPRQLTGRPQAQHEAIQAARQRQATDEFKAQYALRAGVESSLSQGVRRVDRRRSRSIGLARTQVQQIINATAMNLGRLADWVRKGKVDPRKRRPGPWARLAPPPKFGLAARLSSATAS